MSVSSMDRGPTRSNRTAVPQLDRFQGGVLGPLALEEVDIIAVQSSGGHHEAVRVESRGSDGSGAIAQEVIGRLEIGYELSIVDVEDLDAVLLRSTTAWLVDALVSLCRNLHGKDGRVLMNAERAQVVGCRLDGLDAMVHSYIP